MATSSLGTSVVAAGLVGAAVALWLLPWRVIIAAPSARGRVAVLLHTSVASVLAARRRPRRRASCIALLEAVAAELRAGRTAHAALARAAAAAPDLVPRALGAVRLGGDLPTALEDDASAAGEPVLRQLAACWRVGQDSGAGLAEAVARLAASSRESERIRLELASRTAEPKATMRMLAVLPVFGIVMGLGLGADTVGWLLGNPLGRLVLALGLLLDLAGVLWTRRMIVGIEKQL